MRRAMLQKIGANTPLVCDLVGGFVHGYSHRKIRNSYSGDAIEVRESGGNTFDDIGFIGEDLDEAQLTTFVGANDGFERRFYDQIGNRNFVQADVTRQPLIVSSGTVVKVSGKPYAQYNGVINHMDTSTDTPITDADSTVFVVFESQSVENNRQVFSEIISTASSNSVNINSATSSPTFGHSNYRPDGTSRLITFASQQPTSTKRCYIIKRDGNDFYAYDETDTLIGTVNSSAVFSSDTYLMIGRFLSNFFGGKIAELLINNTALSSGDQTTVLNNIKAYYSIP